jgi:hypothetical protein
MRAVVGDQIMIMSRHLDEPVRVGEIIEVHGGGGEPPYVVRWQDGEHTGLMFPGPDAQIRHAEEALRAAAPHSARAKQWQISMNLIEYENNLTRAQVTAEAGARTLRCYGEAHRNPTDTDVPDIGDEVAAGRALIELGNQLLRNAAQDIGVLEGHTVYVSPAQTGSPF